MNLGDLIDRAGRWYPNRRVTHFEGEDLSYGDLSARSDSILAYLQTVHGLRKGDRVATFANNCAAYVEVLGAAAKGGLTVVPLNPRFTAEEARFQLQDSGTKLLFASSDLSGIVSGAVQDTEIEACIYLDEEHQDGELATARRYTATPQRPDLRESDPIFISYTSGTTGQPKGAVMTHGNLIANAVSVGHSFRITSESIALVVMPQSTSGCNHHIIWPMLAAGGTLIIQDARQFEANSFLSLIERFRVTHVQLVPTMIYRVLDRGDFATHDVSSLRVVGYGSAPMSAERLKEALERFGPIFAQVYGQTEATSLAVFLSPEDHVRALDGEPGILQSSGRPVPLIGLRIVDETGRPVAQGDIGEIALQGPTVMAGYWNNEAATKDAIRNGWLLTGDLGREDDTGFVHIVDRKKDMVITGGLNVSSREVEEVIYRHPSVSECAVIGVPDPEWGETIRAVVVPKQGAPLSDAEILALCREHLAGFKCPKSIVFVEALERNSLGKILKRKLKDDFQKMRSA